MTNETMKKRVIVSIAIAAVLLCLLLGFCVRRCNSSNTTDSTQPTQTSQGTDATSLGEVTPIDTTGGASGSKSDKDKSSTSDKNKDKSKNGTSGSNSSSNKNKNGTSSSGGSGTSSSGSGGSSGRSSGGSSSRGSGGSSSNGGGSNGSSSNGGGNNNSSDNPTPTPHTHTPVTDDAVYATCQHVGLTEGSHCSTCGEVLQAQEEIPIRNHVYLDGECIWCGRPAPFGEGLIDELELPEDDFS